MVKLKKILYATDLSPNSIYAFQYAVDLAKKHNGQITILHVVEQKSVLDETYDKLAGRVVKKDQKGAAVERIRKRLEAFREKALLDDPQKDDRVASIEVLEGYPAEEILKKTKELKCDVIVMGTHGKGSSGCHCPGSCSPKYG
ncbi:MAG: universal stress protein [Syntrophales bacterium]|nr:universal stress protein [Syntrophales bacterium]